jgi:hypothetical protein
MADMTDWIPFKEGEYVVERAFLFAPDESAVLLEDAAISVFLDRRGLRQMNGSCRVQNTLLVKLLDDHDVIDLGLDLGDEFKYLLEDPILKGGKIFSPDVRSSLQFVPRLPWKQVPEDQFETLWSRLIFVKKD